MGALVAPLLPEESEAGGVMTAGFPVVKMNGTGNAFVIVDERDRAAGRSGRVRAARLRPRPGFGADGLLLVFRRKE